jgi:hypothetical protein
MTEADLPVGGRTFVKDYEQFANVLRTNLLKLANSPVLQIDDGTFRGYAGTQKVNVIDCTSLKDLSGALSTVPLDVKSIGNQLLGGIGVTPEIQAAMMTKWLALPLAAKTSFLTRYHALDLTNTEAVTAFLHSMIAALS